MRGWHISDHASPTAEAGLGHVLPALKRSRPSDLRLPRAGRPGNTPGNMRKEPAVPASPGESLGSLDSRTGWASGRPSGTSRDGKCLTHNPKVGGSNPSPATKPKLGPGRRTGFLVVRPAFVTSKEAILPASVYVANAGPVEGPGCIERDRGIVRVHPNPPRAEISGASWRGRPRSPGPTAGLPGARALSAGRMTGTARNCPLRSVAAPPR
jgi:hypothetical protein